MVERKKISNIKSVSCQNGSFYRTLYGVERLQLYCPDVAVVTICLAQLVRLEKRSPHLKNDTNSQLRLHCESKNCATFIFTVTLANVGRCLKFFQCRNQKEMAHNKNEKFPTVA